MPTRNEDCVSAHENASELLNSQQPDPSATTPLWRKCAGARVALLLP